MRCTPGSRFPRAPRWRWPLHRERDAYRPIPQAPTAPLSTNRRSLLFDILLSRLLYYCTTVVAVKKLEYQAERTSTEYCYYYCTVVLLLASKICPTPQICERPGAPTRPGVRQRYVLQPSPRTMPALADGTTVECWSVGSVCRCGGCRNERFPG